MNRFLKRFYASMGVELVVVVVAAVVVLLWNG